MPLLIKIAQRIRKHLSQVKSGSLLENFNLPPISMPHCIRKWLQQSSIIGLGLESLRITGPIVRHPAVSWLGNWEYTGTTMLGGHVACPIAVALAVAGAVAVAAVLVASTIVIVLPATAATAETLRQQQQMLQLLCTIQMNVCDFMCMGLCVCVFVCVCMCNACKSSICKWALCAWTVNTWANERKWNSQRGSHQHEQWNTWDISGKLLTTDTATIVIHILWVTGTGPIDRRAVNSRLPKQDSLNDAEQNGSSNSRFLVKLYLSVESRKLRAPRGEWSNEKRGKSSERGVAS